MARRRSLVFTTIRTEGGLLPAELLARVAASDRSVPGTDAGSYHLAAGEELTNRITRSWNRLTEVWKAFSRSVAGLAPDDTGTTVTRERWLQPLFEELGYGRLPTAKAIEVEGRTYALSHAWGSTPVHLVGARVEIDRRAPGVRGASGASPHGLLQEALNRTDHLWGIVSNGARLRLLRDNASLTRQAFVEFDLETMFADEVFDDFVVFWLTCHQSRVEGDDPTQCWLERWTQVAADTGTRAREELRGGVEKAIEALGTGFVADPANYELKEQLRGGALTTQDYYRQLLRVVYRLLFLFVAEDRDLLHPPTTGEEQRRRYARFYSLGRVRTLAQRRRGGPHPDLWESLSVTFAGLGGDTGIPELGLPGLGSFLWSDEACSHLVRSKIANQHLLSAVRNLGYFEDPAEHALRPVDYHNLGTEELGAIYESLLEQHPDVNADAGTFALNTAAGNERKTTGSYYTPTSLITELLNSALDPVLAEAAAADDPEAAILDLKVLDPACGSGHFLIAAAHRISKRLAAVRTGDDEPAPEATRKALRDVVGRCLHGIDVNPMAVELCKVSLWMEAMEPGKPLGFLDHRIMRGNALLGATPELLEGGVPDEAFKPLTGDDKAVVSSLRTRNKKARSGQGSLSFGSSTALDTSALVAAASAVDAITDETPGGVATKAKRWYDLVDSAAYRAAVHAANTWCANFVAPKRAGAPEITHEQFELASTHPEKVHPTVRATVDSLADSYGFFHWHLAFLDLYGPSGRGGFDVVLGNPPWEKVKLSEKEFFAARAPEIATLAGAKRKTAITRLQAQDPELWDSYQGALRQADGESHMLRTSGRFPLCGRGDVNTYAVFAELMRDTVAPAGRLGVVVPTGIATDDTTKYFFADCVEKRRLASLFDFENAAPIFQGVHRSFKFCLLTLVGASSSVSEADFTFFAHRVSDLNDPERRFTLSPDDLALMNPNTRTTPVFRTRRDAEITRAIYSRVPVLIREGDPDGNPWGVEFSTMFHMTNDSQLFRTADELRSEGAAQEGNLWRRGRQRWLPLYEAKMAHHFNHRFGDYSMRIGETESNQLPAVPLDRLQDPAFVVQPRYWVVEEEVRQAARNESGSWLLGFRNVCRNTDERTFIASPYPDAAIGHSTPLISTQRQRPLLMCLMDSFALDYACRQKLGGTNMTFFVVQQLPVLEVARLEEPSRWAGVQVSEWLAIRALELVYTAWDLEDFGAEVGYGGPPFRWAPDRRELLRAELDASFFHLYGLERADVDYIMDTFPIVRRKDEAAHGEYRTKRLVLERYDALADAIRTGIEYQTVLDPPPADPSLAHPESTRPEWSSRA